MTTLGSSNQQYHRQTYGGSQRLEPCIMRFLCLDLQQRGTLPHDLGTIKRRFVRMALVELQDL